MNELFDVVDDFAIYPVLGAFLYVTTSRPYLCPAVAVTVTEFLEIAFDVLPLFFTIYPDAPATLPHAIVIDVGVPAVCFIVL